MTPKTKELYNLLIEVNKLSKKQALTVISGLTGEGLQALANDLRRKKVHLQGLKSPAVVPLEAPVKAKKVPYTVLLPPKMVEGLKSLSDVDGAPVSHHIRMAILAYLDKRR